MKEKNEKIELLAPAGDFESLKVAIGNGADSVYIGSQLFSARQRAKNFTKEEIADAIDYAHLRSVKVYLAINVLISDNELQSALECAIEAWENGIDAIIIQDMGFARLLKKTIPEVIMHASTQATIYDKFSMDACKKMGFSRIILPRELSINEITNISEYAKKIGIELEIFAHGSLCVGYSGQCLLSSAMGGRSGNRGDCAQPCRLEYSLQTEDNSSEVFTPRISLKDMSVIKHIKKINEVGVTAIKIEGRMKSPEYVGIVTSQFKNAIDFSSDFSMESLQLAFNRGGEFTDAYLLGEKSPSMMSGEKTGSHGVFLGTVSAVNSILGIVDLNILEQSSVNKGDIVSIRRGEGEVCNAPIGSETNIPSGLRIKGFHPDVIKNIREGDKAYKMTDSILSREVLRADTKKTKLSGILSGDDTVLNLKWEVISGLSKGFVYEHEVNPQDLLEDDSSYPNISQERCIKQLSKSGGTPFEITNIKVLYSPALPISHINKIRRESLEILTKNLIQSFKRKIKIIEEKTLLKEEFENPREHKVSVYLYEWDGKSESLPYGADIYELPFWSFILPEAFDSILEFKKCNPNSMVSIYLPPAIIENDYNIMLEILQKAASYGIDFVLSGNLGNSELSSSFGLDDMRDSAANIYNYETANLLMESEPFSIMPSLELSFNQIKEIMMRTKSEKNIRFELPMYGRLRLMYSEHCPVGLNKKDCSICKGDKKFALVKKTNEIFPVICHNSSCTADILSPYLLCAPDKINQLSSIFSVIARVYFTTERKQIQEEIIKTTKEMLSSEGINTIKKIFAFAEDEALRQKTIISNGYYDRGIH